LQERVSAYSADLENERKEIARMRQEETERHSQHKEAIDDFRAEIARLHGELRAAGLVYNERNRLILLLSSSNCLSISISSSQFLS